MTVSSILALTAATLLSQTPAPASSPEPTELTLEDALSQLDRQNLTLSEARARAGEAAGVAQQATAAVLPSLSAQGSYVRNSSEARVALGDVLPLPPGTPRPEPITIQPLEAFTATGILRVPLVVPNAWFDAAQARAAADAAERAASATRLQLRAGFAQAAYAARAAEEVVAAAERARTTAAQHARSAERRVAAGTAAPLDRLRAETDLVARESELVRARSELDRARLALGILLGRRAPVRVLVPEPLTPTASKGTPDAGRDDAGDVGALVEEALASRPELAARRAQVDAAEQGVRSARSRLLPQLSGSVSAFASDVPYPTGEKDGWRATVDLTWLLFDGGLRAGKRRQATAALEGARASAEAGALAVAQEVADAARDLGVARERLRLAEQQRALAADAQGTAERSFEAGLATSLDVADASDRLFVADVGLADARARLAQARIALDRSRGRAP